ncbi:MAG: RibD family protein [Pseudomonadota bacterium]
MFLAAEGTPNGELIFHYDPQLALTRFSKPRRGRGRLVIGQLGQSLDGRIATPTGASKYINGKEALTHLHRLRASVDAVIVGVGTAVADDPQLTCRHVPGAHPTRVVIDPNGRLPRDLQMLQDGSAPVLVVTTPGRPVPAGAEALEIAPDAEGRIAPDAIIAALDARGLTRLLVEGGAETLARFVDAGLVDELHLMLAPIVLGSGKTGINLAPITALDEALRPMVRTMLFDDGDMLCVCEFQRAEID